MQAFISFPNERMHVLAGKANSFLFINDVFDACCEAIGIVRQEEAYTIWMDRISMRTSRSQEVMS
jgi:hypothetical protein